MKKISIVIPCYQCADNIPDLCEALLKLQEQLNNKLSMQVIFVDDGSTDGTLEKLIDQKSSLQFPVRIVKLSGNFGSYNAFLAGLNYADGDCFVQLHADLQDPPEHIPEMVVHWLNGFKLVIGQRISREENWTNHIFSHIYHFFIKNFALRYIPSGGYDLVLFDKQLRDQIVQMNETNTNLVYLISWLRFPYITVPLIRRRRTKGKSQWSLFNKFKLFIDSLVSFSYLPIIFTSLCAGLCIIIWVVFSILYILKIINIGWFNWFLLTSITFLFINISIVAEYLWRTLEASRKRPPYIVDKIME